MLRIIIWFLVRLSDFLLLEIQFTGSQWKLWIFFRILFVHRKKKNVWNGFFKLSLKLFYFSKLKLLSDHKIKLIFQFQLSIFTVHFSGKNLFSLNISLYILRREWNSLCFTFSSTGYFSFFSCVTSTSSLFALWFTIERQFVAFAICSKSDSLPRCCIQAHQSPIYIYIYTDKCDIRMVLCCRFDMWLYCSLRAFGWYVNCNVFRVTEYAFFFFYILCCCFCVFKSLLRPFNWLPESVCRFTTK